jgi:hypothetical protein
MLRSPTAKKKKLPKDPRQVAVKEARWKEGKKSRVEAKPVRPSSAEQ